MWLSTQLRLLFPQNVYQGSYNFFDMEEDDREISIQKDFDIKLFPCVILSMVSINKKQSAI